MNEKQFHRKLKEKWFDSLEEGSEILLKTSNENGRYVITFKDHMYKNVRLDMGKDQLKWFSLDSIHPIPDYMDTELYKAFTKIEDDDEI